MPAARPSMRADLPRSSSRCSAPRTCSPTQRAALLRAGRLRQRRAAARGRASGLRRGTGGCGATRHRRGPAVVPRGGGMSYTDGYLPIRATTDHRRHAAPEPRSSRSMPRIATSLSSAACTWKELARRSSRTACARRTGGRCRGCARPSAARCRRAASSWGRACTARCRRACSASTWCSPTARCCRPAALRYANGVPFFRHFGPDLSGLFTGDCGALGIKARATLRLIPAPAESRYLSFSVRRRRAVFGLMADVAREGLASECLAFDPGLQAVRMKRVSLAEDAKALGQVVTFGGRRARGPQGGRQGRARRAQLPRRGRRSRCTSAWTGATLPTPSRVAPRIRALADGAGTRGREHDPEGDAGQSVHGSEQHARAGRRALGAGARHRAAVARRGDVRSLRGRLRAACDASSSDSASTTVASAAPSAATACSSSRASTGRMRAKRSTRRCSIQRTSRSCRCSRRTCRHGSSSRNCAGNSRDLFAASGAASFQIGKLYRYRASLDAGTLAMLDALKRQLDPRGLMNPGVLGFAAPTV